MRKTIFERVNLSDFMLVLYTSLGQEFPISHAHFFLRVVTTKKKFQHNYSNYSNYYSNYYYSIILKIIIILYIAFQLNTRLTFSFGQIPHSLLI